MNITCCTKLFKTFKVFGKSSTKIYEVSKFFILTFAFLTNTLANLDSERKKYNKKTYKKR